MSYLDPVTTSPLWKKYYKPDVIYTPAFLWWVFTVVLVILTITGYPFDPTTFCCLSVLVGVGVV